jgi:hypothetical protein
MFDFLERRECADPSDSVRFLALNLSSPIARVQSRVFPNLVLRRNGLDRQCPITEYTSSRPAAGVDQALQLAGAPRKPNRRSFVPVAGHISGGGKAPAIGRFFQGCNNQVPPPKTAPMFISTESNHLCL